MNKNAYDRYQNEVRSAESWQRHVFGEQPVYPGHPILLGVLIMDRYENFAHATRREPNQHYSNAARDSFVPGAGCAVASALDVLRIALSDAPDSLDRAFAEAERYWRGWEVQSLRNADAAARGRIAALGAKSAFIERLTAWKRGELNACPHRKSAAALAA